jgi:hypothetical protein
VRGFPGGRECCCRAEIAPWPAPGLSVYLLACVGAFPWVACAQTKSKAAPSAQPTPLLPSHGVQGGLESIARGLSHELGRHALAAIERLVTWWEADEEVDQANSQLRVFMSSLSITPITFTFTFARSASCMDASLTSPITVTLNALGLIGASRGRAAAAGPVCRVGAALHVHAPERPAGACARPCAALPSGEH